MWRHRSHVHSIRHMPFPISGHLVLSLYLSPFSRYLHISISGSRPLPFGVTRLHQSFDQSIPQQRFPIGVPCDQVRISSRYRDIQIQTAWPVQGVIAHARYHVTCPPCAKVWIHIWICHPLHCLSLWHFHWALRKNKGCLLLRVRPPMLNAKSSENFLSPKPDFKT